MAIYHFSAKVISRANGSSALAAAAYRSASRVYDQRLDRHHDFSNKAGVVHSEVMLPDGAPEPLADREVLWNEVEAVEKRVDAQLAREIEFAIPRELDQAEGIRLAREFVAREFVDRGMIADLNVHWDIGADGEPKPHAHVMLTTRSVDEEGFGAKVRDWNRTDLLEHWREAWAEHVNTRLAEIDIDARVDHRSFDAQGIELEPQHKIGPAAARMAGEGLESERLDEHHAIARANGEKILVTPSIALDAITRTQATFTTRDLAMFVHRHSDGKDQFDRVMAAVRSSPELIALGKDGRGNDRFTSRDMIETERRLERATDVLAGRSVHGLAERATEWAIARSARNGLSLGDEQLAALGHITKSQGLAIVIGYAGTGKSSMLGVARDAWESAGYRVQGAALSGIAAQNLQQGSGIASRTLASLEHQWGQGRELLSSNDVLVIDEAGMIGSRQFERVMSEAEKRGAKVVLVGDPEQLQAIEAGAAFRSTAERHGGVEITEVRRQREDWQRDATRYLATERTGQAIAAYREHGAVHVALDRDAARTNLIERWDRDRTEHPAATRIILTHTNDEVQMLNRAVRQRLRAHGALSADVTLRVEKGERAFAAGDRVMFGRNERGLGVKNGSLGTVDNVSSVRMSVMLDDGRSVAFDFKDYAAVDHGYAATIHKAQGMTVDRVQVLATPGLDRHAAYVALSRHRDQVELHYGQDDFADEGNLLRALSRERGKDMAADYKPMPEPALTVSRERRPFDPEAPFIETAAPSVSDDIPRRPSFNGLNLALDPIDQPSTKSLEHAVERHGRIVRAITFARSVSVPITDDQKKELRDSRTALDGIRPAAARNLESAMAADRGLISQTANGRTATAIRAMQLEAEMRDSPTLRADTFVARWQALERQRTQLRRYNEDTKIRGVENRMLGMAKSLERDPQVESILRNRRVELGLYGRPDRGIGQVLADMIGRGRSRGLGIGM